MGLYMVNIDYSCDQKSPAIRAVSDAEHFFLGRRSSTAGERNMVIVTLLCL